MAAVLVGWCVGMVSRIYWKSPHSLLKGQLYDPLDEATHTSR